jgi:hypothetical protein
MYRGSTPSRAVVALPATASARLPACSGSIVHYVLLVLDKPAMNYLEDQGRSVPARKEEFESMQEFGGSATDPILDKRSPCLSPTLHLHIDTL